MKLLKIFLWKCSLQYYNLLRKYMFSAVCSRMIGIVIKESCALSNRTSYFITLKKYGNRHVNMMYSRPETCVRVELV